MSHNMNGLEAGLTFGAIGVFWTGAGIYQLMRGNGTGDWRAAQGEVTAAFLSEEEQEDEDLDSTTYGQKKMFYKPGVLFKYSVRGKEYEGDRMQEGLFKFPFRYFAEQQISGYRPGQKVTVYVSPRDPSKAVLKRGPPIQAFIMLGAGIAALILALVLYKALG